MNDIILKWRGKINDSLIEHKTLFNSINRSLNNSIAKYDSIIIDNLSLPGIVGITCKYKNFKEYFEFIHNELKSYNAFKEQQLLKMKKMREEFKNLIKQVESQLFESNNKTNLNFNTKMKELENFVEDKFNVTQNTVQTARIENSKYAMDLIDKTKELQIYYDGLKEIKKEIYEQYEKELEKFKKEI